MIPTRLMLKIAAAVLALLGAGIAGFCLGRPARRAEHVESAPVVEAIKKIARLATVEVQVSDVVRYEEVKTILVWDIPKNATLRLRGRVQGGFDLQKGFRVVPDAEARTLRVDLPPPEVLSVDDRIEWFQETSKVLNPITPQDRTRWTSWARGALARSAKDAGLYEKAAAHAKELLTEAAAAFGWKAEIRIGAAPGPAL